MAGIRRTIAQNGGASGGKGPGGGMGTGAEVRSPPVRDAKGRSTPLAESFVPPSPLPATAVEGIEAVPAAEAAPVAAWEPAQKRVLP